MAEHDSHQERTERATPKRLKEARDKGQVARSRELNTMAMLVAAASGLLLLGQGLIGMLTDVMRRSFAFSRADAMDAHMSPELLGESIWHALVGLGPFFLILIAVALLSSTALGGFAFSTKALGFQWSRINPAKGLKRVFSAHGLAELLKALVKFAVVASVAVWWLWSEAAEFLHLGEEPLATGLAHAGHLVAWSFLVISAATVLIAGADVPFQLWQHARQLKMTRQEVRDELKETEGKPEVRQRIRSLQREIAQRRMMEEVPKADVIVTNPTHYAVALRYDASRMRAPLVVAKGVDLISANIRRIGEHHKVPVFAAPPLARALYYSTDLNREIPAGLYLAVAQVLAYVFQLRQARPADAPLVAPTDLPIPPELRRDA